MADNKKYYYLKVKDNFFDSEEMIILQNMQDGYLYSDILMKLYLRSLKNDGKLMFRDLIPYTPSALAQVVRHQVGTVEKALKVFKEIGLIDVLDNGAIYMLDIQNFIGLSSTEADRKRRYRDLIRNEIKQIGQMSDKCPDKSTPELEIELEIRDKRLDIDIDKDKDIDKKKKYGKYQRIKLTDSEYKKLVEEYGQDKTNKQIELLDEYIESNNNKNKYTNFNLVLRKSIRDGWFKEKENKSFSFSEVAKEMEENGW